MPFLNGGLFEPMNGYSWETTHIRLPDELFSNNTKTKEGDIGDGILDVFDRYNFTVNESEPLEQEVAVDPEMLGKVFENLLEIKDRKSKGAFYTPREIVHYMCQESLINYLETETNSLIPKTDIELFIQQGSQIIQNDKSIIEQGGDKGKLLLRQSVIDQAEELDDLLANIKVCDPAVGSGAFPLGMLNEIVTARTILGIHLKNNPSAYKLKLHAISNSIYGVDIDPGAVEIAKLRFWLSLVVEEDNPTPLPNLEHKIMQGNSLISQYEGIELFDDDFLNSTESINDEKNEIQEKLDEIQKEYFSLHGTGEFTTARKVETEEDIKRLQRRQKFLNDKNNTIAETGSLFDAPQAKKIAQEKAKLLQSKIAQYVTVDSRTNKENLKQEIDDLKWDLIEATLEERGETDKLDEIKRLRKDRIKPFFIWKLEFGDVFKNNGGFDIMIANPPYIFARNSESKGLTKEDKKYYYENYELAKYQINTYPLFLELGTNQLRKNGVLVFITPNNWLTITSNKDMRKYVLNKSNITIVNFYSKVFESASVDSSIIMYTNNQNNPDKISLYNYQTSFDLIKSSTTEFFKKTKDFVINIELLKNIEFFNILNKIEINSKTIEDFALVKSGLKAYEVGKGKPKISKEMKDSRVFHSNSKEDDSYLQYVVGRDVKRYKLDWSGEYLKFGDNLAAPRGNFDLFSTERILVRQIPSSPPYCINAVLTDEIILNDLNSMNIIYIKLNPHFMLGVLNSRLISFWFEHKFGKLQRGIFPQFKINELKIFPIVEPTETQSNNIAKLSNQILTVKKSNPQLDITTLEKKIDQLVYQLYDLTDEEIAIVEKSPN